MAIRSEKLGSEVHSFGVIEEAEFTIQANAQAFRALSSTLYADKISSIIRELSTNAYDSHVYAGNEEPFEIELPSALEQTFTIRDYGIGMTKEELLKLYNSYFKSGDYKLKSNDYVGCFGLGSKSPFAYTKNFTVISFKDGIKYACNAFINEKGVPVLNILSETETDKPNGVEIKIPVKNGDTYTWNSSALNVYRYFKMIPKGINITRPEPVLEGTNWKIVSGTHSAVAVIGNIGYPINAHNCKVQQYSDEWYLLQMYNMELHFNIGELDITLSREALEYTERTQQALVKRAKEVLVEAKDLIEKEIATQPTRWDARLFYYGKLRERNSGALNQLKDKIKASSLKWKGKPIHWRIEGNTDISFTLVEYESYRQNMKAYDRNHVGETVTAAIFIEDERGTIGRVKEWVKNNASDAYIVHSPYDEKTKKFDVALAKKFILDNFECADAHIKYVSTLPKVVSIRSGRRNGIGARTSHVFTYRDQNAGSFEHQYWTEKDIDVSKTKGVYVKMSSHKVVIGDKQYHPSHIHGITDWFKFDNDFMLVGVRITDQPLFEKSPDWIELGEYIKDHLTKQINDKYFMRVALGQLQHYKLWKGLKESDVKSSVWTQFIETVYDYNKRGYSNDKRNQVDRMVSVIGFKVPASTAVKIEDLEKEVLEKYGILKVVSHLWDYTKDQFKFIQDAVNALDNSGV